MIATKKADGQIVTLNELALEVHANSVNHGFWEGNPTDEHFLCLIASELMEAVEAMRKGHMACVDKFEAELATPPSPNEAATDVERYAYWYNCCIKDSVGDELADVVIRIMDLAGARGVDLDKNSAAYSNPSPKKAFTENAWSVLHTLTDSASGLPHVLRSTVRQVAVLASQLHINLWWHVQAKMRYNASRPYKHGKAF